MNWGRTKSNIWNMPPLLRTKNDGMVMEWYENWWGVSSLVHNLFGHLLGRRIDLWKSALYHLCNSCCVAETKALLAILSWWACLLRQGKGWRFGGSGVAGGHLIHRHSIHNGIEIFQIWWRRWFQVYPPDGEYSHLKLRKPHTDLKIFEAQHLKMKDEEID